MFTILFTLLLVPFQVHPLSFTQWQQSPAPLVQALIDTARIIGLPRLKTMDSSMYRTIFIHEIQSGPIYRVHPRRAFIREYVK